MNSPLLNLKQTTWQPQEKRKPLIEKSAPCTPGSEFLVGWSRFLAPNPAGSSSWNPQRPVGVGDTVNRRVWGGFIYIREIGSMQRRPLLFCESFGCQNRSVYQCNKVLFMSAIFTWKREQWTWPTVMRERDESEVRWCFWLLDDWGPFWNDSTLLRAMLPDAFFRWPMAFSRFSRPFSRWRTTKRLRCS